MRSAPTLLLVLSFPAGLVGYAVSARVLTAMGLQDVLVSFLSLFVAGLVMLPFLIPFFDRKAKADLAAHRQTSDPVPTEGTDPPGR